MKVTKTMFAATGALLLLSSQAHAQLGALISKVPSLGNRSSGSGDVNGFLASAQKAEALTRISAVSLLESISSKEEAAALRARATAAEAVSDPKEREAALRQVSTDVTAQLAATDFASKSKELEGKATEAQRRQIGASVYNLALAILMDRQAIEQGRGLLNNPMSLAQGGSILKAKDAFSAVGGQMANLTKIGLGLPKLMSVGRLSALPTSAADAPKSVAD
ncbi:hypothetical protein [uncultured Caulobacter sp.]|jgi:hypothetical protein|uniref:hypothetical protein n=1 Tax=uncultured Caulobacter sp. TaxID=158749 RepID=UPI00262ABC02|nr:hypothetical protein [uncultured Caulobacter sp.]